MNIFDVAQPQAGEFFRFVKVGDSVQGTYIDSRQAIDSFNFPQTIYVIKDKDGKIWNLGFRDTSTIIHDRMKQIRKGQIVGFRFDEERDSKKNPAIKAKIIRIYADPKAVDQVWLAEQKEIEKNFPSSPIVGTAHTDAADVGNVDEELGFNQLGDEETGDLSSVSVEPETNEAFNAVRTLAKTKGLVKETDSDVIANVLIEQYAGLELKEENLTKIIIALTGYTKK